MTESPDKNTLDGLRWGGLAVLGFSLVLAAVLGLLGVETVLSFDQMTRADLPQLAPRLLTALAYFLLMALSACLGAVVHSACRWMLTTSKALANLQGEAASAGAAYSTTIPQP